MTILAINGGSSSIRFALFEGGDPLRRVLGGKVDGIGKRPCLQFTDEAGASHDGSCVDDEDANSAVELLLDWLQAQAQFERVHAVGHRLVHGMARNAPTCIDAGLLEELRRIVAFVPEHLPLEIRLIEALRERHPQLWQVACFDTAFHRSLPRLASLLPIPRRYHAGTTPTASGSTDSTVTTLFHMTVLNELDRFHLVMAGIKRLPLLGERGAAVQRRMERKLVEHRRYIEAHGEDMPEIRDWKWKGTSAGA
ncbi:MAG: hypothetical protein H0W24_01470 [Lysobacter sp.]|nr:hypothetical protein [Lysobacter sp.]